ncbi:MAG: peroxiredoxin [Candidatus Marinimicrobia bacterium]|nr:peroxiredoxin [Candidatus Neomarinimicrobiota bacterium]|tara:strand:- start:1607 stop:2047 length:441 start_codon:yes stop_codon:yes gene_type:complete
MKKLPKFKLALSENLEIHSSDIKNSILFFYPKAMTSGCTIEVCDFQANFNKFKKLGFTIIGISKDDLEKNLKFAKKYKIKYPLASDKDKVCEKLGIWVEKSMYGKKYYGISRSTFIIDSQGKIFKMWNKVKVAGHVKEVLETLKNI